MPMKFLIALTLIISTFGSSEAQTSTFTDYFGKMMISLTNSDDKTDTSDTRISATMIETKNGRISIYLASEMREGCIGFSLRALGESDGFGNYELYENKQAYLDNLVMGTITQIGNELRIQMHDLKTKVTKGKKGRDCKWDFGNNFFLKMSRK